MKRRNTKRSMNKPVALMVSIALLLTMVVSGIPFVYGADQCACGMQLVDNCDCGPLCLACGTCECPEPTLCSNCGVLLLTDNCEDCNPSPPADIIITMIDFGILELEQTHPVGTELATLHLPENLVGLYGGGLIDVPVTWESEPAFDADTEDTFTFTAVIADTRFVLDDGVELPKIAVTIEAEAETTDMVIVTSLSGMVTAINNAKETNTPTTILLSGEWDMYQIPDYREITLESDVPITLTVNTDKVHFCVRGTLNLHDGITLTRAKGYDGNGGGVRASAGTFNMYGGQIIGNQRGAAGGGVIIGYGSISGNGKFNMYGGEISGNTAATHGGGVSVGGNETFNMYGGTISGNTAGNNGGGVGFTGNGAFTMTGGTISGNYASNGGGVGGSTSGNFIMKNGTISGNTATVNGGGISSGYPTTITGGEISGNEAYEIGGAIFVNGSNANTITTALKKISIVPETPGAVIIEDNKAGNNTSVVKENNNWFDIYNEMISREMDGRWTDGAAYGYNTNDIFAKFPAVELSNFARIVNGVVLTVPTSVKNLEELTDAIALANELGEPATILLEKVIGINDEVGPYTLESGVPVTLTVGERPDAGSQALRHFSVADTTLTMGNGITLTRAEGYTGEGGGVDLLRSTFIMNGGEIRDNKSPSTGGGVNVLRSTFIMNDGIIEGNETTSRNGGGGVYVHVDGAVISKFEMNGGKIIGNYAGKDITDLPAIVRTRPAAPEEFLYGGGGIFIHGEFVMTGGEISGNYAYGHGGAILHTPASFGNWPVPMIINPKTPGAIVFKDNVSAQGTYMVKSSGSTIALGSGSNKETVDFFEYFYKDKISPELDGQWTNGLKYGYNNHDISFMGSSADLEETYVDLDSLEEPGKPVITDAASDDDGKITVKWEQPTDGGEVDEYEIIIDGDVVETVDGDVFEFVTGELKDGKYKIIVRARNAKGTADSEEADVVVKKAHDDDCDCDPDCDGDCDCGCDDCKDGDCDCDTDCDGDCDCDDCNPYIPPIWRDPNEGGDIGLILPENHGDTEYEIEVTDEDGNKAFIKVEVSEDGEISVNVESGAEDSEISVSAVANEDGEVSVSIGNLGDGEYVIEVRDGNGERVEASIASGSIIGRARIDANVSDANLGIKTGSASGQLAEDGAIAIDNSASPRTGPVNLASGSMAIVNLLLCSLGAVLAVLAALRSLKKNRYSAKHGRKTSQKYLSAAILMAIAGVAIFLLTQDLNARTVLIDQWTIANAALLVFEVAALAVSRKERKEVEN